MPMKRGNHQITSEFIGDGEVKKADLDTKITITLQAWQETAASNTIAMGICPKDGTIVSCKAACITVPASGESMSIDVKKNNVSILSSPITIDDSATARTAIDGTLDSGQVSVSAGDFFEAELTYTAGGSPTPMTDTVVTVEIELS